MLPQKQAEEAMISSNNQTIERDDREEDKAENSFFSLKSVLWHGGSVYDAWFSCASNQVLYDMIPQMPIVIILNLFDFCSAFLVFVCFAGCPGSVNLAMLFLSAGNALRNHVAGLLWHDGKLDCVFD